MNKLINAEDEPDQTAASACSKRNPAIQLPDFKKNFFTQGKEGKINVNCIFFKHLQRPDSSCSTTKNGAFSKYLKEDFPSSSSYWRGVFLLKPFSKKRITGIEKQERGRAAI